MSRSTWVVGGMLFGVSMALLMAGMPLVRAAGVDDVGAEYERRLAQLQRDDIAGQLELAHWCRDQQAWELVRKQCTLILKQEGEHAQAKLLLELAMRHLRKVDGGRKRGGTPASDDSTQEFGRLGRIVSDAEIRRIRWMEMMDEEPRPLSIAFKNKVIQRFLDAMEGNSEYTSREKRRDFMLLKPTEKLQRIRKETEDRFYEDIVIKTDPKRMADFERHVLPPVLAGCATSKCHGNPETSRFVLYTDRIMSKNQVYTNYLIMHGFSAGGRRLINRDLPEQSLLLTYGFRELPAILGNLDRTFKHPPVGEQKNTEIRAIFRGGKDPRFRAIRDWLKSLSALEPDYGISLEPSGSTP